MPAHRSSSTSASATKRARQRRGVATICAALMICAAARTIAVAQAPSQALPAAAWEPTGPVTTWRGISFIVPAGMRGTDKRDFYDMAGPGIKGRLGQCSILIMGEVPAGPNLARQAHELLVEAMAGVGGRVANSRGGPDLTSDLRVGRSGDGWLWVELNGMLGEGVGGRARIMLIARGATVVPVIAVAGSGNGCVGLQGETTANGNTITWLALYYSLKLPGATPSTSLREQIIGSWDAVSVSVQGGMGGSRGESYASNGRYGGIQVAAGSGYARSSAGDGRYVVEGHRLTIFPDQGPPQTHLARIIAEREGTTPPRETEQLCKISVDVGGPYERCLPRTGR